MRISDWSSDVCSSDLAGWFSLTRLDHAIVTVTDEGVTAMTAALNLSKQVSDLAGVAPDIVTAQSEKDLQALDAGIKEKESRIEATLGAVSADRKSTRLNSSH